MSDRVLIDRETGEVITLGENECPHCDDTDKALRTARAQITKLKKRLTGLYEGSPTKAVIEEVFAYWVERLEKNANTVLGDERAAKVEARLKENWTVDQLKEAIDGCLLDDWAMGRAAKARKSGYHDLGDHICDRASTVEHFRTLLLGAKPKPVLQAVPKPEPLPYIRPIDRVAMILRREWGIDGFQPFIFQDQLRADTWQAVCPVRPENESHVLHVTEPQYGGRPTMACMGGCPQTIIRDALIRLEQQQVERLMAVKVEMDAAREDRDPFRSVQAVAA